VSSEPIEEKVARVLSSRELVVRGAEHGVELGMDFEVLDPIGNDILDPDTHEVIGSCASCSTPGSGVSRAAETVDCENVPEKAERNHRPRHVARRRRVQAPSVQKRGTPHGNLNQEESFVKAGARSVRFSFITKHLNRARSRKWSRPRPLSSSVRRGTGRHRP
jgi:hypothetical protein